ncbi:unnamed protein product [Urochloa humidicola]
MGDSEVLGVRFHFNGVFILDGSSVEYCNGDEGVSHIEKDKLSIPELEGHLLDHTTFRRSVRMYWLPSGASMNSGMRMLVNDQSCLDMLDAVAAEGAVDIYTELVDVGMAAVSDTAIYGVADEAVFDLFRDENVMNLDALLGDKTAEGANALVTQWDGQNGTEIEEEDEADNGWDVTGFTSDEDDEAREMRTEYKAYVTKRKKGKGIPLDNPTSIEIPTGNDSTIQAAVDEESSKRSSTMRTAASRMQTAVVRGLTAPAGWPTAAVARRNTYHLQQQRRRRQGPSEPNRGGGERVVGRSMGKLVFS